MCPPCFYGTRCQFTTSGFGLSLDAILGYHILPHVGLRHQPFIIQMSLAWTIIFMLPRTNQWCSFDDHIQE